jgi:predicted PurR-regulated permease PerM
VQVTPSVPFPISGFSRNEQGSEQEKRGLLDEERGRDKQMARMTICVMASLCVLLIAMVVVIIILFVRVEDAIETTNVAIAPHVDSMVASFASIINNTRDLTFSLVNLGHTAEALASQSAPVLGHAVNTTASLLDRADAFSANPILSIASGRMG